MLKGGESATLSVARVAIARVGIQEQNGDMKISLRYSERRNVETDSEEAEDVAEAGAIGIAWLSRNDRSPKIASLAWISNFQASQLVKGQQVAERTHWRTDWGGQRYQTSSIA